MAMRCCWPPDNCRGKASRLSSRPTRASSASAWACASARSRFLHLERAEQQVVDHAHVAEQVVALEHHANPLANVAPVGARVKQLLPGQAQVAAMGLLQAVEAAQQRAFAATAGAEDDHHFAGRHLEVDVLEHLLLAKKIC